MTYHYNPPRYPAEFFEEDGVYLIGTYRYHVLAVADTKFGRLAWATMELHNGQVDVQTLLPDHYALAIKETP